MNLTQDEIASLELRGMINDLAPPPPPVDALQKLAVQQALMSSHCGSESSGRKLTFGWLVLTLTAMCTFFGNPIPFRTTRLTD